MKQHMFSPQPIGSLATRQHQPEWMDQPELDVARHRQALAGLARINWISGSSRIFWPPLRKLAQQQIGTLHVLDLACGGGDVTIQLALRAKRCGINMQLEGCDVSTVALECARDRATAAGVHVTFQPRDVLNDNLPPGFDAVISSLFLHHLSEASALHLLRQAGDVANRLVLVNDLVRCRRAYWLAVIASRILTRSPVVHVDGPLSVAAAFTVRELQDLAQRAGLNSAQVQRHWPFRCLLQWWKP